MAILTRKITVTQIVDDKKRAGFCFMRVEDNDKLTLESTTPMHDCIIDDFINQFKAKQETAPQPEPEKPAQNEEIIQYPKSHEKKDSK